ncbi:MAG: alpha/beta hydrolase [Azospirillaceae bacterium]
MSAIWGDYDQAGLDAQYNLRAAVPAFPKIAIAWRDASDRVIERLQAAGQARLGVAYGPGNRQRFDIFLPAQRGDPVPALIFIHGGYWQAMTKEDFAYLAPAFVDRGVAFVTIDYDLCPTVRMTALVAQVATAIATIARQAAGWDIDPSRLVLSGHSAGGHLTALMLLRDWAKDGFDRPPVRAGLAMSGLFELEPIRLSYLNDVLRLDPAEVEDLSPRARLRPVEPRLLLAVGARETDEFRRQQADFARAWKNVGNRLEIIDLPDRHHFDAVDAMGERGYPLHERLLDLVKNGAG